LYRRAPATHKQQSNMDNQRYSLGSEEWMIDSGCIVQSVLASKSDPACGSLLARRNHHIHRVLLAGGSIKSKNMIKNQD
jgi:hypothetical protein